ncbi:retrovirus-related pol polyprotein from transposon TNT 1-94, partial [Tanacetum coccineum]
VPRAWFERLSKALFDLGFKGSKMDPSLFIYSRGDTLLYILVYVDDIIVTGNNKGTIDNIIYQLGSAFALKDLGPRNYFLGIEIVSHVSGILLSRKKYILELLQSAGLSNCNLVSSLMVTSSSLSLDDSTAFFNPVKYQQVVGSLQYVTLSWLDIAFAVNKVCQYMHAPTENHWSAIKRILRYLHGTVEHGMLIRHSSGSTIQAFTNVLWKGNPNTYLKAFSDADWAGDLDDRWSTGGFAIYLEAEYKALAHTIAELTWLQALLNELGIHSSSTPILYKIIRLEVRGTLHTFSSCSLLSDTIGWEWGGRRVRGLIIGEDGDDATITYPTLQSLLYGLCRSALRCNGSSVRSHKERTPYDCDLHIKDTLWQAENERGEQRRGYDERLLPLFSSHTD